MSEWTDRRERNRSPKYIVIDEDMTKNELLRQENNKPITDEETKRRSINTVKGKMISSCLQAYVSGNMTAYDTYSDNIKEIVQTIYKNAVKDNHIGFMGILLDRSEGKVKDEIDLKTSIKDLSPDQEQEYESMFTKQNELDTTKQIEDTSVEQAENKGTDIT